MKCRGKHFMSLAAISIPVVPFPVVINFGRSERYFKCPGVANL